MRLQVAAIEILNNGQASRNTDTTAYAVIPAPKRPPRVTRSHNLRLCDKYR